MYMFVWLFSLYNSMVTKLLLDVTVAFPSCSLLVLSGNVLFWEYHRSSKKAYATVESQLYSSALVVKCSYKAEWKTK